MSEKSEMVAKIEETLDGVYVGSMIEFTTEVLSKEPMDLNDTEKAALNAAVFYCDDCDCVYPIAEIAGSSKREDTYGTICGKCPDCFSYDEDEDDEDEDDDSDWEDEDEEDDEDDEDDDTDAFDEQDDDYDIE